jgi:DNA polymerase III delta prime subunit
VTLTLPIEKTPPSLDPATAKVLLYGPPKVGKSTLAAGLDTDHTLFIATEPGLGALEVYSVPVTSWTQFREVGAKLAENSDQFKMVVIDTVDELYRMVSDDVCTRMGVEHPSDKGYGKVWGAIASEFRLRVGKLSSLGLGIWFVSHSKDVEIEKSVGKITKTVPTVAGQAREFLIGFCDYILYATSHLSENGEQRVIHSSASENFEAGCRGEQLPDPLELRAETLRDAMQKACTPNGKPTAKKTAKPQAVAA